VAHLGCLKTANKPVRFHVTSQYRVNSAHIAKKEAALSGLVLPIFLNNLPCGTFQQGKLIALNRCIKHQKDLVLYLIRKNSKHSLEKVKALLDHLHFEKILNTLGKSILKPISLFMPYHLLIEAIVNERGNG